MKKSKIALVVVLALVLSIACISVPTFSWYVRPNEQSGNKLSWNSNYTISNGKGISMQTLESKDGGKTYTQNVGSFSNELSAGDCKYYRTEIHNTSTSAQNVSLFLSQLDLTGNAGGKFYLGVNGPLRTYKNYSDIDSEAGSMVKKIINEKNVYVGFNVNQTYTPQNYAVHWWKTGNDNYNGDSQVKPYFSPNKQGDYAKSKYNMSYATIPYDANAVRLRQDKNWYGGNNEDLANKNTIIVYSDNGNVNTDYQNSSLAAGIESFYSSAGANVGDTVDLAAKGHTNTFAYTSSDESVATVDSNGQVKAKKAGHTSIILTSTGAYGDKITAACWLTVHGTAGDTKTLLDVPVATNIKVAPKTEAGDTVVSVYWYIKNEGNEPLKYTIEDIYLTL